MRSTLARLTFVLLAISLVTAACSNDKTPSSGGSASSEGESEGGTITVNGDTANDHGTETVSGDEIKVEMDDFYFEPTVIQGDAGAEVKIELDNEGSATHNFSIDDQSIDQDVESGEDGSVTVTLPDSGMLEFYCKFHKSQGMVGALSV